MEAFEAHPTTDHVPDPSRRRPWALAARVAAWAGGAVAVLVLVAVGATLVALHSLDRPWLKSRIQKAARESGGVEIDYASVSFALFSGLTLEGVVVRSPEEVRGFAPDLVRLGRVDVRWHLASLLGMGSGPMIDGLHVSDVALAVVEDENGRTSFDAIPSSGPPPKPSEPVPLSHQAANALRGKAPVGEVVVSGVALALVQTVKGAVASRTELGGLGLALKTATAAEGWTASASLGTAAKPLELDVSRAQGDAKAAARAAVWLVLDASSSAAKAALDLRMVSQTFAPSVAADHWLHAEAALRFDPGAGKTLVTIDHTDAGDGAVNADASIELLDHGDPIVKHAQGDLDAARLLGWLPAGLVPVTAAKAHVHVQVDALVAAPAMPRLADGGSAVVDAELSKVTGDVGGPLRVDEAKLSLHAEPGSAAEGGIAAKGAVALTGVKVASGGNEVAADRLDLACDARQAKDGAISGRVGVRFGRLNVEGPTPVVARDGDLQVDLGALRPNSGDPLATTGDVRVSLTAASIDVRSPGISIVADGLRAKAHTRLDGHPPYALELDAPISHLRVLGKEGGALVDAPFRLETKIHDAFPDLPRPAASRAVAHVAVDLGNAKVALEATKAVDAVDYALSFDAPSLGMARPFLPQALAGRAPWDGMAVALRSNGHVQHLGGGIPAIKETTELEVQRPAFDDVSAKSIALKLQSDGDAVRHHADLDLRAQALVLQGETPSDDHLTLVADFDRDRRSAQVKLGTEGRVTAKASASVSFDASKRALPYDLDLELAHLAPLRPFLAKVKGLEGLDLSEFALGLSSNGTVFGAVADVGRDGTLKLEPHLTRTAGVVGKIDLKLSHLHWGKGDTAVLSPAFAWHADLGLEGARRTVKSHLEAEALHLDLGPHDVDLVGLRDDSTVAVSGDLLDPESEVKEHTVITKVEQDYAPDYPVGDVDYALTAERARDGTVHVTDLKFANAAGGTTFGFSGNAELDGGRRTLSIATKFGQDLTRLTRSPDRFAGKGTVELEANVSSPDLVLYRVRAAMKVHDVSVTMPKAGVDVRQASGEVPITVTVEAGANGVNLRPDEKRSPYSMLRFADQHPLLSRSGFLSVASIKTPMVSIAPLVGNLEIEQNVISLRQFEMGIRGGSITGQMGLDWDGPKSSIELHVRATGVQSSHGEPFDGNIAVVVSAGDRTVEGRAEILRIGERHLLDLLDLQDPSHVDPAMNRIRTALLFGYPDHLRLVFDHGFASAKLELGGLARLVSIGELRGIPMGPLVDKFVTPILDPTGTQ
ncbi:MAG TPA: hypothetical protein VGI39_28660 [Polyangiaceae bacterium]|jgi:hypothetical protein